MPITMPPKLAVFMPEWYDLAVPICHPSQIELRVVTGGNQATVESLLGSEVSTLVTTPQK